MYYGGDALEGLSVDLVVLGRVGGQIGEEVEVGVEEGGTGGWWGLRGGGGVEGGGGGGGDVELGRVFFAAMIVEVGLGGEDAGALGARVDAI
jgi:hypothetical protein